MKNLIAALSEVYPEIPLPQERLHSSHPVFRTPPIAWFGQEDPVLFLALDGDGLVLAEPKLCWDHPNIPSWHSSARFTIPNGWSEAITPDQRETLKRKAQEIGEARLAKYAQCSACGERCMPEHLADYNHDGKLFCESCANQILGVIH